MKKKIPYFVIIIEFILLILYLIIHGLSTNIDENMQIFLVMALFGAVIRCFSKDTFKGNLTLDLMMVIGVISSIFTFFMLLE